MIRWCERSPVSASSSFEVLDRSLTGRFDQLLLEVAGISIEKNRKSPVSVQLDGRVARGAGSLLVCSEQRILERVDEGALVDAFLALDRLHCLDDLSRHLFHLRRSLVRR